MTVILVGSDAALMEGLAQTFAAQGMTPHVVGTLLDAYETAQETRPTVVVIDRALAVASARDAMSIPLAAGGSIVLYRSADDIPEPALPAILHRSVLAELTLPLERKRLVALTAHVRGREVTTGRSDSVYHPPLEVRA